MGTNYWRDKTRRNPRPVGVSGDYAKLAQEVTKDLERTHNPKVGGSNPPPAIKSHQQVSKDKESLKKALC
jgi:hypothetical protein